MSSPATDPVPIAVAWSRWLVVGTVVVSCGPLIGLPAIPATVALIVATTRVFLATLPHFGSAADLHRFDADWALIPARVTTGNGGGTVFTLMLLHASLLHLVGNMLFLWTFGDTIENAFGPFGFLAVSLLCGLAAAAQAAGDPGSTLPMVGASGAIAGVMGACLLLFPRHPRDAAFR